MGTPPTPTGLLKTVERYMSAKETVISEGFASEIDWQDDLRFADITESDFLREAAWVILNSGMRESVIRRLFPAISSAFLRWRAAAQIVRHAGECKREAMSVYRHPGKLDAILAVAREIDAAGFAVVKRRVEREGVGYLRRFPFMGPATSYHLAKNLGLSVVKPDRHLVRTAAAAGYTDPDALCRAISDYVGDRLAVVDLVIWRFATLIPQYEEHFAR